MRYLVTGAAGFIGYHVAAALSDNPDNFVICVDDFSRGENDELYRRLIKRKNVAHLEAELNSLEGLRDVPDDVEIVFHLAALNGTQNFYERPFDVVKSCTLPTIFLLEKYGRTKTLKRFIYAGSSEAYASTVSRFGWPVPTGEDVPLGIDNVFNARWSYGASKLHGEIATINGCRHFGKSFTVIRYHNVYGPRMGDKHVVPDFLARARNGIFSLYGHKDTRTFIYIDDAVRGTIELAHSPGAGDQVVNLGGSREITIRELGEAMMRVLNRSERIELHDSPSGSVARRAPDLSKIRALIGFSERWSLEQGLAKTARYYLGDEMVPSSGKVQ